MSIFVTGDCHADFRKFSTGNFPCQKGLSKNDYVIIAGDFGGYWDGTKEQRYWRKWLSEKPFRTLFVDGNHENFAMLGKLPAKEWHGGKVHELPGTDILHLMRGQMYDIDGCKIFAFGGAASHDVSEGIVPYDGNGRWKQTAKSWAKQGKRFFRIDQISWWKEEMPSREEMDTGMAVLSENAFSCDYIITHDCPTSDLVMMYHHGACINALTDYLEEIRCRTRYRRWYFGHHHGDKAVTDKEIMLYNSIAQIW